MVSEEVKERLRELWRWQSVRELLVITSVITVVISLFQISLDPLIMLRGIASNFITCLAISICVATITTAIEVENLTRDWRRLSVLIALLVVGGMLGGLISWWVNSLLFPYQISHPGLYLTIIATLTVIFGMSIVAYQNISQKLQETASRLAEKEVLEEKLLRLKTEAELEALRARVNPHFLFNTLNSIASLIPGNPERAEEVVLRMSNLFHYILSVGDRDNVSLSEELDIVEQYLQIEKIRLGSRLEYNVDLGDASGATLIPGMILQPLVENSVKYAVAPEKNGGKIEVKCKHEDDRCLIVISDNGKGFDSELDNDGFGIAGVRQRLELNYPDAHEFTISSADGVSIRIAIPVAYEI